MIQSKKLIHLITSANIIVGSASPDFSRLPPLAAPRLLGAQPEGGASLSVGYTVSSLVIQYIHHLHRHAIKEASVMHDSTFE